MKIRNLTMGEWVLYCALLDLLLVLAYVYQLRALHVIVIIGLFALTVERIVNWRRGRKQVR